MTPALRYAHTALAAALAFILTATAVYLTAHTGHWLAAAALIYTAALFTWIATREYALHKRTVAEHQWARHAELGEQPPPLDPCCYLGRATRGAAHDHQCTDPTTRHTDDPRSAA